jgi:hypothetical protein
MNYKESAIESFRENIINEYDEYSKYHYRKLQKIVAETVSGAQDLETKLAFVAKENSEIVEFNFDRFISSKKLLQKLKKTIFFSKLSVLDKKVLIKKLSKVIDCRNWVIHCCFREYENQEYSQSDDIFLKIADDTNLFMDNTKLFQSTDKTLLIGGFDELEINIANCWTSTKRVDFNRDKYQITCPSILKRSDWVATKIIITKYLIFEFLDVLNKNPFSIYAD